MSVKFLFVPPDAVPSVWGDLAPAITKTAKKLKRPCDEQEVMAECVSGKAWLFLLDCGGFLIARHLREGETQIFHVWLLYSESLGKRLDDVVREVDRIALGTGCDLVRFQSPRKFWRRFPHFREASVVYERVPHGQGR